VGPASYVEKRLTTRMHRAAAAAVVAAAFCLAALSSGCGGNGGTPSATNVETKAAGPAVPAGFTVRAVKDQGFSVALPKKWRSLDAHEALSSGSMKSFEKANPQLAAQIQALAQPNSPLKLLAIGPRGNGFVTNLNVIVTRIPSKLGFDEWTSTEVAEIQKVSTVKGLKQEKTQLQPGQALHLGYRASFNRAGGSFEVFVHQWMLKDKGVLYILTFTTSPAQEPKQRKTFDDSAHSFRLTGH
jgi:hypothetical protein